MSIYSIYKATCIVTNKSYIGFDSHWPRRKRTHKWVSQKENNTMFYNAIRKYGWDNFQWEILYQSKDRIHTLNVMEPHFIKEYNTFENGYNMTIGGDRGPILIGEKNGMFGKDHSQNVKNKLKQLAHERFSGKTYEQIYGKEKSDELKRLRSENSKGKNNSGRNNPRFDKQEYVFYNVINKNILKLTRYDFYTTYGLNKSGVSDMINHNITYKNWKILWNEKEQVSEAS